MTLQTVTATLAGGAEVFFDVEDTTADDHDETGQIFEMFVRAVGK